MIHVNELTYRIEGRTLFDAATVALPPNAKVGFLGRNGTGKSTLLKLMLRELAPETGDISVPPKARVLAVDQEAPGGPDTPLDVVLAADAERAELLAEAEIATDPARIAEIQTRLSDIQAHAAPARAGAILHGLGFSKAMQDGPCSDLSGGWRMRVSLAKALFAEPDVLLLDEPTNYLDLEGALWLQAHLKRYPRTALVVSHDREILENSVDHILHLRNGKLALYAGDLKRFEKKRREEIHQNLKLRAKQESERRHLQAFVDRFRAKATKATQAQSRLKRLEKMEPIPAIVEADAPIIHLENPRVMASPILRLENAQAGYGEKVILRDLNLRIDQDDRIALLGPNGAGKSTLAKLLDGRIKPLSGARYAHKKLEIGFFAQHQLDDLHPKQSCYDHVRTLMPDATEAQVRAKCGAMGFPGRQADTSAEELSGGEKARLLLHLVSFHGPHLLILDEPTNHLDLDARAALETAINDFEGAVILISHDASLIESCADRLWLAKDGGIAPYPGDMDDYRRLILAAERGDKKEKSKAAADTKKAARQEAAQARQAARPHKKRAEDAEKAAEKLRAEIARIDAALADPALYDQDPAKAADLAKRRHKAAEALELAETTWLEASEAYEQAVAEAAI